MIKISKRTGIILLILFAGATINNGLFLIYLNIREIYYWGIPDFNQILLITSVISILIIWISVAGYIIYEYVKKVQEYRRVLEENNLLETKN